MAVPRVVKEHLVFKPEHYYRIIEVIMQIIELVEKSPTR